ncbi:site-specific integrase [Aerococcaceae bacterium zg-BR9]|uniref:site-specific integrase n=1 Tax=Aerococcaceae bacterium zg-1292 TaxID=2774330 RepID=UPI0040634ECF|nr:site-specific integrase [Aerococcaceae bacterium zg-BR9]MBF6978696.1 site-specific integrase [Aerococcaceae bacterium zg-BR22]
MIKEYYLKDGSKRYMFQLYLGVDPLTGKKRRTTRRNFKTKKEASIELARLKVQIEEQGLPTKKQRMKFQEVFDLWKVDFEQTVKESTYYFQMRAFRLHILPKIGNVYIDALTPQRCQKLINEWCSYYKKYSSLISLTNRVLNYAIALGLINDNPMMKTIRPKRRKKIDEQPYTSPFYDLEQLKTFLDYVRTNYDNQTYLMFHLLAYTGMRKGELLALRWCDFDELHSNITINQTLSKNKDGKEIFQTPKTTASNRTIALDNVTTKLLTAWRTEQKEKLFKYGYNTMNKKQLIFTNLKNQCFYSEYVNYTLSKILKANDLPHITVHGFRHTHCSLLFESGATLKQVQDRLGHTDIKTTMDIYNHVTPKQQDETAELFANFVKG